MARITVFTAARMAAIEAASIVAGTINGSGHLILTRNDGSTVDAGAVLGSVPAASQTVAGLIELADNTEAAALTASDRALTPSNLPSVAASNTDVSTGTATNRFVTPVSSASPRLLRPRPVPAPALPSPLPVLLRWLEPVLATAMAV
jgi:hypothetical protein